MCRRSVLLLRRMIIIMDMRPVGDLRRRWGLLGGGRGGIMIIMSILTDLTTIDTTIVIPHPLDTTTMNLIVISSTQENEA